MDILFLSLDFIFSDIIQTETTTNTKTRTIPTEETWPRREWYDYLPEEKPEVKYWFPVKKWKKVWFIPATKQMVLTTYLPDWLYCWRYSANLIASFRIYRYDFDESLPFPPPAWNLMNLQFYLSAQPCLILVFCEFKQQGIKLVGLREELVDCIYLAQGLRIYWDPEIYLDYWLRALPTYKANKLYSVRIDYFWVSEWFNPFALKIQKTIVDGGTIPDFYRKFLDEHFPKAIRPPDRSE